MLIAKHIIVLYDIVVMAILNINTITSVTSNYAFGLQLRLNGTPKRPLRQFVMRHVGQCIGRVINVFSIVTTASPLDVKGEIPVTVPSNPKNPLKE